MDDHRFDAWVRAWARQHSRRRLVRGLLGGGALLAVARFGASDAAARGRSGPGEPCRHDDQCRAADAPLVCAWNGFGHDGDLNCCTYEGSRCGDDRDCCGWNTCDGGFCSSSGGSSFSSAGNAGVATADASGGFVSIGDINSGGNVGNAISIGNTSGSVRVSGGEVSNVTDVSVSADGGMAIADASGGSGNVAGGGDGYYDRSGQYVDPGCSGYPLGPGCGCWRGPYDDDPCAGSMVCCRQAGDNNGVCLEVQSCSGWYGPGEACPGYCDWGRGCPSCTTGYCNWFGDCDYPQ